MTGHEKIAARNIRNCFNFEIGGIYNSYMDGETDFPTLEDAKELIYYQAMHDKYTEIGCYTGCAPKEMRFAGRQFCSDYIDKLFETDPDVAEIPWKGEE